jgi:hypothetical protein
VGCCEHGNESSGYIKSVEFSERTISLWRSMLHEVGYHSVPKEAFISINNPHTRLFLRKAPWRSFTYKLLRQCSGSSFKHLFLLCRVYTREKCANWIKTLENQMRCWITSNAALWLLTAVESQSSFSRMWRRQKHYFCINAKSARFHGDRGLSESRTR